VKPEIEDIIFFIGLLLTTTGLWLFSPALSLTIAGVILMLRGYLRAGGES